MSSANRERRVQNREARIAAEMEAVQRAKRRKVTIAGVGVLVAVGVAVGFAVRSGGSSSSAAPTTTSPSTTTPTTVATKPAKCVAEQGQSPPGAPKVPVVLGPAPTRLVRRDLTVGTGPVVKPTATVTVDYIGVACSTGVIFDSSYATGQPVSFPLGNVIKGWSQGIPGMRVGGSRLLGIPPDLAYGAAGAGSKIGPNETLWFVVHVRAAK